ncbi:hypothetical protein GGTG_11947 [Gaeumannomyces tritici R3-111a-1]|uniref:Uncharacterized protein n=1 Tax=Gaeumannomyces tritici (strain R3-111a-1) TaxID=644352 RepID=J3PEL6_GAET3|nr:hypothetical protein GGTG_11947 [Gaeumannomyces tritici R3-111a-1]EJT70924.1 hypothetical protein GGTG_11947 [Gaeumannomyces tritici R3-111a-1]
METPRCTRSSSLEANQGSAQTSPERLRDEGQAVAQKLQEVASDTSTSPSSVCPGTDAAAHVAAIPPPAAAAAAAAAGLAAPITTSLVTPATKGGEKQPGTFLSQAAESTRCQVGYPLDHKESMKERRRAAERTVSDSDSLGGK